MTLKLAFVAAILLSFGSVAQANPRLLRAEGAERAAGETSRELVASHRFEDGEVRALAPAQGGRAVEVRSWLSGHLNRFDYEVVGAALTPDRAAGEHWVHNAGAVAPAQLKGLHELGEGTTADYVLLQMRQK